MTKPFNVSRRELLKLTAKSALSIPFIGLQSSNIFSMEAELQNSVTTFTNNVAKNNLWASGGTSSIKDITYENPLLKDHLGNVCRLIGESTKGPCYSGTSIRSDISEGQDGLPVRLWFKIVDEQCNPIEGASVDIWHCDPNGLYSGDDMWRTNFCSSGDKNAQKNDWFRGIQISDENGLVYFETCFPGWYVSRAIHIHAIISKNDESYTTQVGFQDSLSEDVSLHSAIYKKRGVPAINNETDGVFPSKYDQFLMDTQQLSDNSMLAWKTLSVSL